MTKSLYLDDTYLFKCNAKIMSMNRDEKGMYVTFDQTVFYPQGGGQPSDVGMMMTPEKNIPIYFVKQIEQEIRHYIDASEEFLSVGENIDLEIDEQRHKLNACYHTAAHLISNILEELEPNVKAVKGHSFPGESYIECSGESKIDALFLQNTVNEFIQKSVVTQQFYISSKDFENTYYKLPYEIPGSKEFRVLQIGNLPPIPCGGTHVQNISELGTLIIRKVHPKNDKTKVSYQLN